MEILKKIRAAREIKGFSQEYVASKIGIETVNYGRIERGQAKLSVERLIKICKILELNPAELFEKNENQILTYLQNIYETETEILLILKKLNK
jgi:transcriptional regulator with XRE-family HTH domain